jgi:hypothetical protein
MSFNEAAITGAGLMLLACAVSSVVYGTGSVRRREWAELLGFIFTFAISSYFFWAVLTLLPRVE